MSEKEIKRILLTTGYTTQTDKDAIYHYIKELKEVIEEVRKSLEDYQEYIDEAKEFYSDLEDDDVVKVSNLQILNNQMVRNYDLLQILDKVKENK